MMNRLQGLIAWACLRLVYPLSLSGVRRIAIVPLLATVKTPACATASHPVVQPAQSTPATRSAHPTRHPRCVVCETGSRLARIPSSSPAVRATLAQRHPTQSPTQRLTAAARQLGLDEPPHSGPYPPDTTLPWANNPEYQRQFKHVSDLWDFGLALYLPALDALNAEFKRRQEGEDQCAGVGLEFTPEARNG